jgi:hypothetical protein
MPQVALRITGSPRHTWWFRKISHFQTNEAAFDLPMDSRLMPLSGARVDVAQTHRFPEFLQAPRQPVRDIWAVF